MNYTEASAIGLLTIEQEAALITAIIDLEDADEDVGLVNIKAGRVAEAIALARTAPVVLERGGEILGLFPTANDTFTWLAVLPESSDGPILEYGDCVPADTDWEDFIAP
jgi:hypothetical protein